MIPKLTGMVHLGPLPGSPRFDGDIDGVIDRAVADAAALRDAGFAAVMMENFGDAPFFADDVPKVTVAAMTRAAAALRGAVDLPLGINVLRNDAAAALAVAAAVGAQFIRVNVLSGVMYTDQGPIVGKAADVMRSRAHLAPGVAVFADVFVKHATAPAGTTVEQAAEDLARRALADAVVVSGSATGREPDRAMLEAVRGAVGDTPLVVGSGATDQNVAALLAVADGVIAGTSVKVDAVTTNPVDPRRAAAFVRASQGRATD
jgi:membrane complex biogenesis BtpA family protein